MTAVKSRNRHGVWLKCVENDTIYHLNNLNSILNFNIGWKLKKIENLGDALLPLSRANISKLKTFHGNRLHFFIRIIRLKLPKIRNFLIISKARFLKIETYLYKKGWNSIQISVLGSYNCNLYIDFPNSPLKIDWVSIWAFKS